MERIVSKKKNVDVQIEIKKKLETLDYKIKTLIMAQGKAKGVEGKKHKRGRGKSMDSIRPYRIDLENLPRHHSNLV